MAAGWFPKHIFLLCWLLWKCYFCGNGIWQTRVSSWMKRLTWDLVKFMIFWRWCGNGGFESRTSQMPALFQIFTSIGLIKKLKVTYIINTINWYKFYWFPKHMFLLCWLQWECYSCGNNILLILVEFNKFWQRFLKTCPKYWL